MDILLLLIDLTVYIEKKKIERVRELNTKSILLIYFLSPPPLLVGVQF